MPLSEKTDQNIAWCLRGFERTVMDAAPRFNTDTERLTTREASVLIHAPTPLIAQVAFLTPASTAVGARAAHELVGIMVALLQPQLQPHSDPDSDPRSRPEHTRLLDVHFSVAPRAVLEAYGQATSQLRRAILDTLRAARRDAQRDARRASVTGSRPGPTRQRSRQRP